MNGLLEPKARKESVVAEGPVVNVVERVGS